MAERRATALLIILHQALGLLSRARDRPRYRVKDLHSEGAISQRHNNKISTPKPQLLRGEDERKDHYRKREKTLSKGTDHSKDQ
ncbi:uncharacterized protein BJX67DRAFT_53422 [Aspergillus lucknowensis]|uniref:Secreted protein n=1 Tax=Aspergillus lucknowensis TaxID=176173 RepID=A0ABR4LUT3_9EURO